MKKKKKCPNIIITWLAVGRCGDTWDWLMAYYNAWLIKIKVKLDFKLGMFYSLFIVVWYGRSTGLNLLKGTSVKWKQQEREWNGLAVVFILLDVPGKIYVLNGKSLLTGAGNGLGLAWAGHRRIWSLTHDKNDWAKVQTRCWVSPVVLNNVSEMRQSLRWLVDLGYSQWVKPFC